MMVCGASLEQNIEKRQCAYLQCVGNLRLEKTFRSFCVQFLFTVASNDILSSHSIFFLRKEVVSRGRMVF